MKLPSPFAVSQAEKASLATTVSSLQDELSAAQAAAASASSQLNTSRTLLQSRAAQVGAPTCRDGLDVWALCWTPQTCLHSMPCNLLPCLLLPPHTQVGAAEGVTAQLEEVASQLSAYKTKLSAAQEEVSPLYRGFCVCVWHVLSSGLRMPR